MDWGRIFVILPAAAGIAVSIRVIAMATRGFRTAKPRESGKIIPLHAARPRNEKPRNTKTPAAYRGTYLRDMKSRETGDPAGIYGTGPHRAGVPGMSVNGMGRLNTNACGTGTYGPGAYATETTGGAWKPVSIFTDFMVKLVKRVGRVVRTRTRTYGKTYEQNIRPAHFSRRGHNGADTRVLMADVLPKGMAHELNNLLTPIMGCSGMLRARLNENDPMRADIDEIYASSKRAKELIQRFSSNAEKTPDTTFHRLNLDEMISRTIRVAELAKPGHAQIFSDVDFKGEQVMGNPAQISQVILNLFTNAFQATKRHGGIIWIRGGIEERNDGRFARISVADDGVGISGSNIGKVFDPFFTTKRDSEGTGLGLSILREIIARHGGTVRAASAPGKSTVFIVYIPIIGSVNTKGTADTVRAAMDKTVISGTKHTGRKPELSFTDYLKAVSSGGMAESGAVSGPVNAAGSERSGAMDVMNGGNHGLNSHGNTINNTQIGGAFFEPGVGARPRGVFRLRVLRGGADDTVTADAAVAESTGILERVYTSAKAEGLSRGLQLLPRAGAPASRGDTPVCYGLQRPDHARAVYDGKIETGHERPSGVVVVDEDAWALDTVERALASGGYGARMYADVETAFEALLKAPCRVLIVSGSMKHGDGRVFAERARKAGCASTVIMMTDTMDENNVYRMLRSGKIDGYVKKPLTVGELMDKIGVIMDPADLNN